MTRTALLWTLLALFAARVFGQLAVALEAAPFLPPMEEWQSGLLPYPVLLVSQVALIAGLAAICRQFGRRSGYFVEPHQWLGRPLWIVGWLYAGAMVVRYAVWMAIKPEARWTGDLIPVVFHIVLASFVIVVADHHRRLRSQRTWVASERASEPRERSAPAERRARECVGESEGRSPSGTQ